MRTDGSIPSNPIRSLPGLPSDSQGPFETASQTPDGFYLAAAQTTMVTEDKITFNAPAAPSLSDQIVCCHGRIGFGRGAIGWRGFHQCDLTSAKPFDTELKDLESRCPSEVGTTTASPSPHRPPLALAPSMDPDPGRRRHVQKQKKRICASISCSYHLFTVRSWIYVCMHIRCCSSQSQSQSIVDVGM